MIFTDSDANENTWSDGIYKLFKRLDCMSGQVPTLILAAEFLKGHYNLVTHFLNQQSDMNWEDIAFVMDKADNIISLSKYFSKNHPDSACASINSNLQIFLRSDAPFGLRKDYILRFMNEEEIFSECQICFEKYNDEDGKISFPTISEKVRSDLIITICVKSVIYP